MKALLVGLLVVLAAALLAVSSIVGKSAGPSADPGREAPTSVPASDGRGADPGPAGCTPGMAGCELLVPAPGCPPEVGEPCIEEFADAALMRWIRDRNPMPGARAVLEVVDGRLLVVGYAHGYGEPDLAVDVVEREKHVSITLRFDFDHEPTLGGDDLQHPVIRFGRVLVELDAALGERPVDVWTSYTPELGASEARD